jgi:lysine 2,3-aminomutase
MIATPGKIYAMQSTTKTLRRPQQFVALGLASPERLAALERVAARYAVAVTPAVVSLIDQADPHDPIARQFIPDPAELELTQEERADPIADHAFMPVEGVVHRYPDRVLLKLVHTCAVYCRFCFRRETVGQGKAHALSSDQLGAALAYIGACPDIWEVILSGGDPLVLSPRRLGETMDKLAAIAHVKVIRVHTRIPVAAPARITPALVRGLKLEGKATYVVVHANHPRELAPSVRAACARIIDAGIPMLSQSVLLAGINDDADILAQLMRAFVECRIKPYYLHHGDLAPGTGHFRTSIACGQDLMRALRGRYSGLCQPTYVLDIPGGHGKSPIGPSYVTTRVEHGATRCQIEDFRGRRHDYPPVIARRTTPRSPA